jgi:endoglucanase
MRLRLLLVLLVFTVPAVAQDRAAGVRTATARAAHLRHGINASEWFAQSATDYTAARLGRYTDDADIALMAKLGFDSVRLSIDPVPLERTIQSQEFLTRLDHAVDTMIANGLAVQIDIHPEEPYKQAVKTSDDGVERFTMLWRRLAAHYANRDPEMVFFEIMNEPEVNDPFRWAGIQAAAAVAIREAAPKNTIIATGPNWSSIADLLTQHPLADGNVIYNFHFYDPHEFTHQGAGWGDPLWRYERAIPYPATESTMKEHLAEVPDPAGRYKLEIYWLDHWDAHRIRLLIDEAAEWGKANNVPLISNEFGVYRRVADPASRNAWIHDVRTALEADGIGWAMWDYHHDFGVAIREEGKPDQPDPATAEALGLKQ